MRLTNKEICNLKTSVFEFDPAAKLFLFGSRTDDTKRGGDIDILIISKIISRKEVHLIRINFFQSFGEQKLDIIVDDGTLNTPFIKLIFEKAKLL